MSIIITIKDNKILPFDIVSNSCNICLQYKKKIQKCSECEFFICDNCLIKWYKYNLSCPHCKFESTFEKPLTNKEKCEKCYNNCKIKIIENHNILLVKIEMVTKYIFNIICNETLKDCLSNTFILCGISLLYILHGLIYGSIYVIAIAFIFLVIIGLLYCLFCCVCCNYNRNYH